MLNRQITIQRKTVTQESDYGTNQIEWIPLVALPGSPVVGEKFWAEVQDILPSRSDILTGSSSSGINITSLKTRIRMRWRDDIDSSMRVVVHGDEEQIYQIIGGPVMVGGRKQVLEILCEKYSTDGEG